MSSVQNVELPHCFVVLCVGDWDVGWGSNEMCVTYLFRPVDTCID